MNEKELLTRSELVYILIGTIIGIGLFQLPYEIVKKAGQDGWIPTILGGVYPLYIVGISRLIINKAPNDNIVTLSKKYFGNFLGTIFSLLYLLEFVVVISSVTAGLTRILRIYVVAFLPYINIAITIIFVSMYATYSGIKNLARMQKLSFYILILITAISIGSIKKGSILNLMPLVENGIISSIKATRVTIAQYSGMEILLLIYPFIKDKKSIYKDSLKSLLVCVILYTWVVFITIYYLGPDIVVKSPWPFSLVAESIEFPVISNTRFIFIFLWSSVVFVTIANSLNAVSLGLSFMTGKNYKNICIFISPLMIYLATIYKTEVVRRKIVSIFTDYTVGFNVLYITMLAILMYISKPKVLKDKIQN